MIASSAENGSSISTTGRSSISVRASAARWRWPPESVAGSWSALALEADPREQRRRPARGPARSPRSRAPSVTLPAPSATAAGRPAGPSRRAARRAAARRCRRPRPASSGARPAIRRNRLLLPTPLGPSRQVHCAARQREVEALEQQRCRRSAATPAARRCRRRLQARSPSCTIPTPLLVGSGSKGRPLWADLSAVAGSPRAPATLVSRAGRQAG